MISILTVTVNRELYLKRLLESMVLLAGYDKVQFEHLIVFQGAPPSDKMQEFIKKLPFASSVSFGTTPEIMPVGRVIRDTLQRVKYPIFMKIDDDCVLSSMNFLPRVLEVCELSPRGIIYPAIVDGETPMPSQQRKRQSLFLERNNLFITLGDAMLPSGKYIVPTDLVKSIPFKNQDDANVIMTAGLSNHLPIFQALNGIIIENQEGYSGQAHRAKNPEGQRL